MADSPKAVPLLQFFLFVYWLLQLFVVSCHSFLLLSSSFGPTEKLRFVSEGCLG